MKTYLRQLAPIGVLPGIEPLPFCPFGDTESSGLADVKTHFKAGVQGMGLGSNAAVPLMTLPICMQFARNMGGRSFIGRRLTVSMFSKAMSNVTVDRVSVPMQAVDRRAHYHRAHSTKHSLWNQSALM